jgi:hypothetical protein
VDCFGYQVIKEKDDDADDDAMLVLGISPPPCSWLFDRERGIHTYNNNGTTVVIIIFGW